MDPSVFHAAVAQAMNADRPDLYWGIDKALRLCMTRTLDRIGAMDPCNDADVADALERTRETLRLFAARAGDGAPHANAWLPGRPPGRLPRGADADPGHEQTLAALSEYATALEFARGPARKAAAAALEARLASARTLLEAPRRDALAAA